MGTTTEKLTYLQGTKDAIKNAIVAKGVEVPEGTTFRGYAEKVWEIPTGAQIETVKVTIEAYGMESGPVYYIDKELKPKQTEDNLESKSPIEIEVLKNSVIYVEGGRGPDFSLCSVKPSSYKIDSYYVNNGAVNLMALRATGDCTIIC